MDQLNIIRIINNNIVTARDDSKEVVLMGKGIGYKQAIGNPVDESKIEKTYSLDGSISTRKFTVLLKDIPHDEIQTINQIVSYAKLSLGKKLSDSIYFSLMDHLHFAIERNEKGFNFQNALSWEVKHFYHHEYLIGKEALEIIKTNLGVVLPEDEGVSIALHLVNAEADMTMDSTVGMTNIIKQVLGIIKYTLGMEFKEDSVNYERLLTHLKFFIQRLYLDRSVKTDNEEFTTIIKTSFPKEYKCAENIADYILRELHCTLSNAELSYLTIHINRVSND